MMVFSCIGDKMDTEALDSRCDTLPDVVEVPIRRIASSQHCVRLGVEHGWRLGVTIG